MAPHRVAMIVLAGTFVLDLAVAVQASGRWPSVFPTIRDEPEAPYEIGGCGQVAHGAGFGSTESLRRHFFTQTNTILRGCRETFRGTAAEGA